MTFNHALNAALRQSIEDKCTKHINARVRLIHDQGAGARIPRITYSVSDWFCSDSTVYSVTNGDGEFVS